MPASKAQIKATNKYNASAYDSLRIVVPKGRKLDVETFAEKCGQSINGLVNDLLRREIGLSESEWKARAEAEPNQEETT